MDNIIYFFPPVTLLIDPLLMRSIIIVPLTIEYSIIYILRYGCVILSSDSQNPFQKLILGMSLTVSIIDSLHHYRIFKYAH